MAKGSGCIVHILLHLVTLRWSVRSYLFGTICVGFNTSVYKWVRTDVDQVSCDTMQRLSWTHVHEERESPWGARNLARALEVDSLVILRWMSVFTTKWCMLLCSTGSIVNGRSWQQWKQVLSAKWNGSFVRMTIASCIQFRTHLSTFFRNSNIFCQTTLN